MLRDVEGFEADGGTFWKRFIPGRISWRAAWTGSIETGLCLASKVRRVISARMTRKALARWGSVGNPSSQPMHLYRSVSRYRLPAGHKRRDRGPDAGRRRFGGKRWFCRSRRLGPSV